MANSNLSLVRRFNRKVRNRDPDSNVQRRAIAAAVPPTLTPARTPGPVTMPGRQILLASKATAASEGRRNVRAFHSPAYNHHANHGGDRPVWFDRISSLAGERSAKRRLSNDSGYGESSRRES